MRELFANGETTEMSGKCIVHLAKGRITLCEMLATSESCCETET